MQSHIPVQRRESRPGMCRTQLRQPAHDLGQHLNHPQGAQAQSAAPQRYGLPVVCRQAQAGRNHLQGTGCPQPLVSGQGTCVQVGISCTRTQHCAPVCQAAQAGAASSPSLKDRQGRVSSRLQAEAGRQSLTGPDECSDLPDRGSLYRSCFTGALAGWRGPRTSMSLGTRDFGDAILSAPLAQCQRRPIGGALSPCTDRCSSGMPARHALHWKPSEARLGAACSPACRPSGPPRQRVAWLAGAARGLPERFCRSAPSAPPTGRHGDPQHARQARGPQQAPSPDLRHLSLGRGRGLRRARAAGQAGGRRAPGPGGGPPLCSSPGPLQRWRMASCNCMPRMGAPSRAPEHTYFQRDPATPSERPAMPCMCIHACMQRIRPCHDMHAVQQHVCPPARLWLAVLHLGRAGVPTCRLPLQAKTQHNKRAIDIPTPPVCEIAAYTREYLPTFKQPPTYMRGRGVARAPCRPQSLAPVGHH